MLATVGERFESEAVREVRAGLARRLAWAALFVLLTILPASGLLIGLGAALHNQAISTQLIGLYALAQPAIAVLAIVVRLAGRRGPGALAVDGTDLLVVRAGSTVSRIPLDRIEEGSWSPRTGVAELGLRGGDRVCARLGRTDARALLEAAGVRGGDGRGPRGQSAGPGSTARKEG